MSNPTRTVRAIAAEVFEPEGVELWMNARSVFFDGMTPIEAIENGDWLWVQSVIEMLADGNF